MCIQPKQFKIPHGIMQKVDYVGCPGFLDALLSNLEGEVEGCPPTGFCSTDPLLYSNILHVQKSPLLKGHIHAILDSELREALIQI
jgi:hypothetical protein